MAHADDLEQGVREFPIGNILTVIDPEARLFDPNGIAGVMALLHYLVGEPVYTNQVIRVIDEVKDEVVRQHPFLRDDPNMAIPETFTLEDIPTWLGWLTLYAGETLPLIPIRPEDHTSISPYDEWRMVKGPEAPIIGLD